MKTKEWTVKCKTCSKEFGYSDRAFRNSLRYGFSRPEYCEECQLKHSRQKAKMAAPYFNIALEASGVFSSIGRINRPVREHAVTEKESKFDETKFGLTPDKIREIADWFKDPNHRVVVVVGPTGSGKSTALPYWLVYPPKGIEEDFFTRDGQILVTQPRIVAVTGLSDYLGPDLMGSTVGGGFDLGFRYSKEDKADWRNAIEMTTDGKLINSLAAGRIAQYGIIIIDEAHERSENIETILRLLKDRMGLYPNLKVIIASATIDQEFFRQYFEQEGARVVEFEGKERFDEKGNPIKAPDPLYAKEDEKIPYEEVGKLAKPVLWAARKKVQWIITEIVEGRKDWGDILVFLQGKKPIDTLVEKIRAWANQDEKLSEIVEACPLYRELEKEEKEKALAEAKPDKIRVVVSTNIAEASVTVKGVVYEVETGIEYQPRFNAEVGALEVPLVLISKANARQRWGRTGRTRSGEVYCLYTEEQFNKLLPEYPIPAMQRVSMENVVLTAKVAGVPNVVSGWLENPPEEEIKRSIQELVTTGALGGGGALTSYGVLIRRFSYPTRLIEVLLAADDIGCSVELATLLPVIKNGGLRRILSWNFNWEAETKHLAFKRHRALMSGCRDDVEFVLKVFKIWDELPHLDDRQLKRISDEEMISLRKQWAKLHNVNHKVLTAIKEERDSAIEMLRVSMRSDDPRKINLWQINRVRSLLLGMLDEKECLLPGDNYNFDFKVEPEAGTTVTCKILRTEQAPYAPDKWYAPGFVWSKDMRDIQSRLMVDQVYIVGHRFLAEVVETKREYSLIQTKRNLTKSRAIGEAREVPVIDDDYDLEMDIEDELQEAEEVKEPEISLHTIPVNYRGIRCTQQAKNGKLAVGDEVEVEIIGFEFPDDSVPIIITKVVPKPEPFEVFAGKYRYGDEVEVEVLTTYDFPNDFNEILVVREKSTGLAVFVEPQDLSFTRNSYVVREIPSGMSMMLNIEHIDPKSRRVRLSNWEETEESLNALLVSPSGFDAPYIARAQVVEVRETGKVVFFLEMSQPEIGLSFITSAHGGILPKEYTDFEVGEEVSMQIHRRDRKTAYVDLPKLPAKARSQVSKEEKEGELSWNRSVLRFSGRMTYDKLYELKAIAEELEFHQALENLYWYSNRIFIKQFLDTVWQETVSERYEIGTTVSGVIMEVNKHGAVIEVSPGVTGFVPRSSILGGIGDPRDLLPVGATVDVSVKEQRRDQQELLLEITEEAVDPLRKVEVGEIHRGVVTGMEGYGVFVNVVLGVDGLAHVSRMYKNRRREVEDLFKEGDSVLVKVNAIDFEKRNVELDMKIPENDPLEKMKVGDTVKGTIVNIKDFGAFVEFEPSFDVDGLLWEKDYPRSSTAKAAIKVGTRLSVKIRHIDRAKRKVSLTYVRRA